MLRWNRINFPIYRLVLALITLLNYCICLVQQTRKACEILSRIIYISFNFFRVCFQVIFWLDPISYFCFIALFEMYSNGLAISSGRIRRIFIWIVQWIFTTDKFWNLEILVQPDKLRYIQKKVMLWYGANVSFNLVYTYSRKKLLQFQ